MKTEVVIMNFDHIYEQETFYKMTPFQWVDCSDITGTDCYCDSIATKEIVDRMAPYSPFGIHFIDSGNYHYVSKFWLDKVDRPFNLMVFDHHPDMQPSLFENLTSCGCWVKAVLDQNPYINKVILVGIKPELLQNIEDKYWNRLICFTEEDMKDPDRLKVLLHIHSRLPVYISIDKDVLGKSEAVTNWDQGTMRINQIERVVRVILDHAPIVGVDICGECSDMMKVIQDQHIIKVNNSTNQELLEWFLQYNKQKKEINR